MILLETRVSLPVGGFDLRDLYASWNSPANTVVSTGSRIEIEAVAKQNAEGEFKPLPAPLHLETVRSSSGFLSWKGLARPGRKGVALREQFKAGETYRLRFSSPSGHFSTVYSDLMLVPPEAVALPPPGPPPARRRVLPYPPITLPPGLAYPFRERQPAPAPTAATPEGTGPTLLTGHLEEAADALMVLVNETPPHVTIDAALASRCLADASGRWTIAINDNAPVPQGVLVAVIPQPELTGSWIQGQMQEPFPVIDVKRPPGFPQPMLVRGRQTTFSA